MIYKCWLMPNSELLKGNVKSIAISKLNCPISNDHLPFVYPSFQPTAHANKNQLENTRQMNLRFLWKYQILISKYSISLKIQYKQILIDFLYLWTLLSISDELMIDRCLIDWCLFSGPVFSGADQRTDLTAGDEARTRTQLNGGTDSSAIARPRWISHPSC